MGTINLVLPGNSFHANHLSHRMCEMDREHCGLPVFRRYGIPVTAFFQEIDLLMKPWLREEMATPGSVEWGNAPFSHTLIPLFEGTWHGETKTTRGTVPVTFFSEFYAPKACQIPTPYTLVLAGNSVLYSAIAELWSPKLGDIVVEQYPDDVHSISFEGKIGILLREEWFTPILKAFFLFQRFPVKGSHPEGKDCLAELIQQVRAVAEGPDDRVVVCPVDMEAPWVGSSLGARVWEIFFEELQRQGLLSVFTPLSAHLERFATEAVETPRPHRELTKWANWEVQLLHLAKLNNLNVGSDERAATVKMIATGSDIFAGWGIKIIETRGKTNLGAVDGNGTKQVLPITFNQSVIDVQLAAYHSLRQGRKFLDALVEINKPDYFVGLTIEMARRQGL